MHVDSHETVSANVVLFIQLNDIYHIDARSDYTDDDTLILPRIQTLVSRLRAAYMSVSGGDCVKLCVPGDFLSPSCMSRNVRGKQMIDIFNHMRVDVVSLGNHEFEPGIISLSDFAERVRESKFVWLNSNFDFSDRSFHQEMHDSGRMAPIHIVNLSTGTSLALVGVLNADTPRAAGKINAPIAALQKTMRLVGRCQLEAKARGEPPSRHLTYIAMTHQKLNLDVELAKSFPEIPLIMGGHDHNVYHAMRHERTLIVKGASNARTIRLNWVVSIPLLDGGHGVSSRNQMKDPAFCKSILTSTAMGPLMAAIFGDYQTPEREDDFVQVLMGRFAQGLEILSRVVGNERLWFFSLALDTQSEEFIRLVEPDEELRSRIRFWGKTCKDSTRSIVKTPVNLRAEDADVRRYSTNLGNLMADIVRGTLPFSRSVSLCADIGLINSGSFRIDRTIMAGESISARTICDIFGHENAVNCYRLRGATLLKVLESSLSKRNADPDEGDGEFLQLSGIKVTVVDGKIVSAYQVSELGEETTLDPKRIYRVATTYYVAKKKFRKFFCNSTPLQLERDVEKCVVRELSRLDDRLFSLIISEEPRWVFSAP